MTKEELAAQLNGLEYPTRIPGALIVAAQSAGLVILCGASDDLMEFYGARREEIGCYDGGTAFVDADGVLPDRDCLDGDEELAEYVQRQKSAKSIEALWCKEDGYSWTYKTEIPHATFEVVEDEEPYCRGIVFALADLA
ncbi:hypothetical protein N5K35_26035 [Pseudomonas sp. GD03651]|uniref:Uncharacterized protein n=2 Tax=Pseudomonas TaxID=286 RepID=B0KKQ7_PSEPG|nr:MULTISPECIES: hypothetical protein [Pseudomonas]ABY99361.1 hypothetical protein PputGB1_3470 [Pseudomonas putida GB-1]AGN82880.1 hypothetical protein L483_20625 [Pseudomonas putida H8234]EKT4479049.1 hypothetical protein [Pseudomonas putida]MBP0706976.1 hypothetical protein [Pseudomonas sp. T34]MCE0965621.1 hypothetical protein [Pseudomonas sp. NMI4491_12]